MKIKVHSNVGRKRSSNQDYADYFVNNQQQALFILCDGVGGHQAGDIASQMTTEFLGERFKAAILPTDQVALQQWLKEQIEAVNRHIYQFSKTEARFEGMGTTLVAAIVIEQMVMIAHVGDSRAYIYYQGDLKQVTEDHSLVNVLIKTGEISKEEGQVHPQRNVVTQSIGGTLEIEVEFATFSTDEIDILMLCSDGLTNMVDDATLLALYEEHQQKDEFAQILIDAANTAGGTDNITVILASDLSNKEGVSC